MRFSTILVVAVSAALVLATLSTSGAGATASRRLFNSKEQKLLRAVPNSMRITCIGGAERKPSLRPFPGSTADIVCGDVGIPPGDVVAYYQFKKLSTLNNWYKTSLIANGITNTALHTRGQCEFNNNWVNHGVTRGGWTCYHDGSGKVWYEWSDRKTLIYASATRSDGDAAQLDDFWHGAGPCLPKDKQCLNATTTTTTTVPPVTTTVPPVTTLAPPTTTPPPPPPDTASLLIGSWLGPEPGFNQGVCSNGTTEYTFNSDGTWYAHMVNYVECGGTFTIGGTYTADASSVTFHYTMCPEGCGQFSDTTENISFIDNNDFSLSDPSFSGTYHRQ